MYTVEFQACVQNGMIEIPKSYQTDLPSQVRVIILTVIPPRQKLNALYEQMPEAA